MAKVYALNAAYCGTSASIDFWQGVGETENPRLLDWFREHGYRVETPEAVVETPVETPAPKPLPKPAAKRGRR